MDFSSLSLIKIDDSLVTTGTCKVPENLEKDSPQMDWKTAGGGKYIMFKPKNRSAGNWHPVDLPRDCEDIIVIPCKAEIKNTQEHVFDGRDGTDLCMAFNMGRSPGVNVIANIRVQTSITNAKTYFGISNDKHTPVEWVEFSDTIFRNNSTESSSLPIGALAWSMPKIKVVLPKPGNIIVSFDYLLTCSKLTNKINRSSFKIPFMDRFLSIKSGFCMWDN